MDNYVVAELLDEYNRVAIDPPTVPHPLIVAACFTMQMRVVSRAAPSSSLLLEYSSKYSIEYLIKYNI